MPKIPIWAAYIIAPVLFLLFSLSSILDSESPVLLITICIVCGLALALALHGYLIFKDNSQGKKKK
jgi:hypothetical protein